MVFNVVQQRKRKNNGRVKDKVQVFILKKNKKEFQVQTIEYNKGKKTLDLLSKEEKQV